MKESRGRNMENEIRKIIEDNLTVIKNTEPDAVFKEFKVFETKKISKPLNDLFQSKLAEIVKTEKKKDHCSLCGTPVKVVGNTTLHYEPLWKEKLAEKDKEIERLDEAVKKRFVDSADLKQQLEAEKAKNDSARHENTSLSIELDQYKAKIEKVREVYDRLKHLDDMFTDNFFINNPMNEARRDMWIAIKHLIEE